MAADATYPSNRVQIRADGNVAVPSGQKINFEAATASGMQVAGNSVLDQIAGRPKSATLGIAASSANVSLVTITVKDETATAMTYPTLIKVWLSDAATGAGLTTTTTSGAVAAGASGVDFATLTTKKALLCQTTTAGVYILSITDTAKTGFYVCAALEGYDVPFVSAQMTSSSYG